MKSISISTLLPKIASRLKAYLHHYSFKEVRFRTKKQKQLRMRTLYCRSAKPSLILTYHRISPLPVDPTAITVSPQNFEEHLQVLKRDWNPISLSTLISELKNGRLPEKSVVLTFDDGYLDTYKYTAPLLVKYEIPSTVFMTTAYFRNQNAWWWDYLTKVFLSPGTLPSKTLTLRAAGEEIKWDLRAARDFTHQDWQKYQTWTLLDQSDPHPRHSLYRKARAQFHRATVADQENILSIIESELGISRKASDGHQMMLPEDLRLAKDHKFIEFGGHTEKHPSLLRLTKAEQRAEIENNKNELESILGYPLKHFAYPYGALRGDYDDTTIRLVKNAGYESACSTNGGLLWPSVPQMELPRFGVRNTNGAQFSKFLDQWTSQSAL